MFGYRTLQIWFRMPFRGFWMMQIDLTNWSIDIPVFGDPQPEDNPARKGIIWNQVHLDIGEATFFVESAGYWNPVIGVSIVSWNTGTLPLEPLYLFVLDNVMRPPTLLFLSSRNGTVELVEESSQRAFDKNGLPGNLTMFSK